MDTINAILNREGFRLANVPSERWETRMKECVSCVHGTDPHQVGQLSLDYFQTNCRLFHDASFDALESFASSLRYLEKGRLEGPAGLETLLGAIKPHMALSSPDMDEEVVPLIHVSGTAPLQALVNLLEKLLGNVQGELHAYYQAEAARVSPQAADPELLAYVFNPDGWHIPFQVASRVLYGVGNEQLILVPTGMFSPVTAQRLPGWARVPAFKLRTEIFYDAAPRFEEDTPEVFESLGVLAREMPFSEALEAARALSCP